MFELLNAGTQQNKRKSVNNIYYLKSFFFNLRRIKTSKSPVGLSISNGPVTKQPE